VTLQRPPVLAGSLELRVKEVLGSEETQGLDIVDDDPNLPGQWVRWEQVLDPGDEGPARRVYAFDETTGEIRFGDGRHGMIPPVGTDSIVAFQYKRTEPPAAGEVDVPGNAVEARTSVNLVTPIAGVETAFAADHAAGGAPAETADRVLRFAAAKLRHRQRAVTAQDIEDLACESSPDIAQARLLASGGRLRLVVVMQGDDPTPTEAQKRELKRLLLAAAAPSFPADTFTVVGPTLRVLRVGLRLEVLTLDDAGAVGEGAKQALKDLLDPAAGGVTADGWPLGVSPSEDELAYALVGVPKLQDIVRIDRFEVRADGAEVAWPAALGRDELARLATDPVRLVFDVTEAAA
jgi:hypothetical protein